MHFLLFAQICFGRVAFEVENKQGKKRYLKPESGSLKFGKEKEYFDKISHYTKNGKLYEFKSNNHSLKNFQNKKEFKDRWKLTKNGQDAILTDPSDKKCLFYSKGKVKSQKCNRKQNNLYPIKVIEENSGENIDEIEDSEQSEELEKKNVKSRKRKRDDSEEYQSEELEKKNVKSSKRKRDDSEEYISKKKHKRNEDDHSVKEDDNTSNEDNKNDDTSNEYDNSNDDVDEKDTKPKNSILNFGKKSMKNVKDFYKKNGEDEDKENEPKANKHKKNESKRSKNKKNEPKTSKHEKNEPKASKNKKSNKTKIERNKDQSTDENTESSDSGFEDDYKTPQLPPLAYYPLFYPQMIPQPLGSPVLPYLPQVNDQLMNNQFANQLHPDFVRNQFNDQNDSGFEDDNESFQNTPIGMNPSYLNQDYQGQYALPFIPPVSILPPIDPQSLIQHNQIKELKMLKKSVEEKLKRNEEERKKDKDEVNKILNEKAVLDNKIQLSKLESMLHTAEAVKGKGSEKKKGAGGLLGMFGSALKSTPYGQAASAVSGADE